MKAKVSQFNKAITLRILTQLKQHMYAQAARSIQSCPAKPRPSSTASIQKRGASHSP